MKKILLIRFSSIGDIVLTTPVIRCLKQQLPEAEIHYCTKSQYQVVLQANPYISKIHSLDGRLADLAKVLRLERFDFVADLHGSLRSRMLKLLLMRPSATFQKLNVKKWLLVKLGVNWLPPVHIVDRYLKTVSSLGIKNDYRGLDYFIPSDATFTPAWLPSSHGNGFIAFVIGGRHRTKIFPAEKVIEVCRQLRQPVVLMGDKNDQAMAGEICRALGDKAFDACGKFDINQSAAMVKQSDLLITNDTGLMHIAAAFGKKIISLWGNTVPAFGMFPYLPDELKSNSLVFEVKGLKCRPCSKIGFNQCPDKHFDCMMRLDSTQIAERANRPCGEWIKNQEVT